MTPLQPEIDPNRRSGARSRAVRAGDPASRGREAPATGSARRRMAGRVAPRLQALDRARCSRAGAYALERTPGTRSASAGRSAGR